MAKEEENEKDMKSRIKDAYKDFGDQLIDIEDYAETEAEIELKKGVEKISKKFKGELKAPPSFIKDRLEISGMREEILRKELRKKPLLGKKRFYQKLNITLLSHGITLSKDGTSLTQEDLIESFTSKYGVDREDVQKSIKNLEKQNLLRLEKSGQKTLIFFTPQELSPDEQLVLNLAQKKKGVLTVTIVSSSLNWDVVRSRSTLEALIKAGIAISEGDTFYFPIFYE
ncbi:MAG: hypothetical protein ACFE68_08735 [Candidatus Hodarchaeota archaeon]